MVFPGTAIIAGQLGRVPASAGQAFARGTPVNWALLSSYNKLIPLLLTEVVFGHPSSPIVFDH